MDDSAVPRVFLLSPASVRGIRGGRILAGESGADFAGSLHSGSAIPLGDIYAFISSLYYRGKRAYARAFGRADAADPVQVITPDRGLLPDLHPVTLDDLRRFARLDLGPANRIYMDALLGSAAELAERLPARAEFVLLGSIATGKYLDPLAEVFGERLLVPESFVGRGNMSRGGLMLRAVDAGRELRYVVAESAARRG
ncbi:MAG TPA: hypothetical protein VJ925_10275 [Longimicrobiales bacterium]|nr:hypothetical protein [Longimicrobiales bacterium]